MSLYELLYRWIDSALCLTGILFNVVLIYCIQTRSPKSIATYSFLLVNCAASDMITCLLTLFIEPRIIVHQDNIYFLANGFCSYFGSKTCYFAYGIMVSFYGHLTVSQLASFVYRWYILHRPIPSKRVMAVVIFIIFIPPFLVYFLGALPYILATCCQDYKAEIRQVHPDLNVDDYTSFGVPHALVDIRAAIPTLWVVAPMFPITIIVLYIRSSILKYLDRQEILNEQTKKMHQNLLKALTLQVFLPPIFIVGTCLYMADALFQIHHPLLEYGLYSLCGMIPILSPLFPLYFVRPYRQFLVDFFQLKKRKGDNPASKNNTVSIVISNAYQAPQR